MFLSKMATPKPFMRIIDSQGSAPGQCGWHADVFKPHTLAIFLRDLAEAIFLRDSSQVPSRKWVVSNKEDPRTIEFRIFTLRAEETQNQLTAWKDFLQSQGHHRWRIGSDCLMETDQVEVASEERERERAAS